MWRAQVLYDWQRGKIPFFAPPPGHTEEAPVLAPLPPHDPSQQVPPPPTPLPPGGRPGW